MPAAHSFAWPFAVVVAMLLPGFAPPPPPAAVSPSPPATYKIIVNAANPATGVERKLLASLFLKKVTKWPDGVTAAPADQSSRSPTRARFSKEVLQDSIEGVMSFWQEQIFSGRETPPAVKGSDEDLVAFVAGTRGGVAYVGADAKLPEGVKALPIR